MISMVLVITQVFIDDKCEVSSKWSLNNMLFMKTYKNAFYSTEKNCTIDGTSVNWIIMNLADISQIQIVLWWSSKFMFISFTKTSEQIENSY